MNETHYDKLKAIIAVYLPQDVKVDDIQKDSHLMQELNINSSHLIDVVLDVEDAFDITIEDEELERMDTVAGALKIIEQKTQA
ncbi:acyl carrier protein [Croceiramulus getboli]|nr:phosphopantetheine-binding protein [Flavobacteriaceae bacterium YJPT1-3]